MSEIIPNKALEEATFDCLRNRLFEAGVYLEVPRWSEIELDKIPFHNVFHDFRYIIDSFDHLGETDLVATANHTARVALDCIVLSDFLGFGAESDYRYQRDVLVRSALDHDIGKTMGDLATLAEKKSGFSEADRERIKFHVAVSTMCTEIYCAETRLADEEVRAVIADHHRWQRNSYTSYPILWGYIDSLLKREGYIRRTPESITLSQFLGVLDCDDAAATRMNTRNIDTPRLLTPEEVKDVLLTEYAKLRIVYKGQKMPKFDISGKELIQELYAQGIIGRANPINPYQEPFSFIRRLSPEKQIALRTAVERKQIEVHKKDDIYYHHEPKNNS